MGTGVNENEGAKPDNTRPAIIIVGAPRSGSYLLATMLESAFDVAIPVDTHFIPLFARHAHLWGNLEELDNRAALLADIYRFLRLWARAFAVGEDAASPSFTLLSTESEATAIIDSTTDYHGLVREMYSVFARHHGRGNFGDKSVYFQPSDIERIATSLAPAKIIHIIRDGRAVCASWRRTWFGPHSVLAAANYWQQHVRKYQAWGERHDLEYAEIRFEDLVRDADGALAGLAGLMGRPAVPVAWDSRSEGLAKAMINAPTHALLGQSPIRERAENWKKVLSNDECAAIEAVADGLLRSLGYESGDEVRVRPSHMQFVAAQLIETMHPVSWARGFKNRLPMAYGLRAYPFAK
jgi:hypothetical protein